MHAGNQNKNMPSLHKKYEEANRKYYGADKDPLKFVPAVSSPDVARDLAIDLSKSLARIDEVEIAKDALRVQARNRLLREETDLPTIENQLLDDRLRTVVVNIETEHARRAPGDFNQDSEQSGAYEMGIGIVMPRPRQEPPQYPPQIPGPRQG